MNLKLSDFDFALPPELIAQEPHSPRDTCRLMVLEKTSQKISEKKFPQIGDYFSAGDVLVLNDTKVIPARLFARRLGKPAEKPIEVFLLKEVAAGQWQVLGRPAKKLKPGEKLIFPGNIEGVVREIVAGSRRLLEFPRNLNVLEFAENTGCLPLPPYIKNYPKKITELKTDYQTVFARVPGATAAPTAGLHFTENLLEELRRLGVTILYLTLHTGVGTFRPIRTEIVSEHRLDPEFCQISTEVATAVNAAKKNGQKIMAVGTTATRALESAADQNGRVTPFVGETDLFIYPGYRFKIIDGLITNFHLPKSSLILLASAFAETEFLKKAYLLAIEKKYRFFSFGDAMLII